MAFNGYSAHLVDVLSGEALREDFPSGHYYELVYWLAHHINPRIKRTYVQVTVFEMDTEDGPVGVSLDLSIRNDGPFNKTVCNNTTCACIQFESQAYVLRHTILTLEIDNWIH